MILREMRERWQHVISLVAQCVQACFIAFKTRTEDDADNLWKLPRVVTNSNSQTKMLCMQKGGKLVSLAMALFARALQTLRLSVVNASWKRLNRSIDLKL